MEGGGRVIQAVDSALTLMRLPGEAMQIDRIMEKFAEKYFRDNQKFQDAEGKQYFSNADSVFTLAFATIMLATDRHNAMIVDKIELSQWKHVRKFIIFNFIFLLRLHRK
jgi:brefeldin A-inhibited guanine nucleotide-exchange protein